MADYNSSYTGQQIDNAVGAGLAVRGVDGIVKSDGAGNIFAAVPGVDYTGPLIPYAFGSAVTIQRITDGMPVNRLLVNVKAVQGGSGNPSPTNKRPITGWAGVNIWNSGPNMLPYPYVDTSVTVREVVFTDNGNGTITASGKATGGAAVFRLVAASLGVLRLPKGSYFFSGVPQGGATNTYCVILQHLKNGSHTTYGRDTGSGFSFSVTEEDSFDPIECYINITENVTVTDMLFQPKLVRTSSDPNVATPITISWQSAAGTIYGGKLDVINGMLTVDKMMLEFDGSSDENWVTISTANVFRHPALSPLPASYNYQNISTNEATATAYNYITMKDNYPAVSIDTTGRLYLAIGESYTTLDQCKSWLGSNPLQVLYPLSTPMTYTLTPTEITTIVGANNIQADAGDIDIDCGEDVKKYIDTTILGALGDSY